MSHSKCEQPPLGMERSRTVSAQVEESRRPTPVYDVSLDDNDDDIEIVAEVTTPDPHPVEEIRRTRRPRGLRRHIPADLGARGLRRHRVTRNTAGDRATARRRSSAGEVQIVDERPRLTPPIFPRPPDRLVELASFRNFLERIGGIHVENGMNMMAFLDGRGMMFNGDDNEIEALIMRRIERDNERAVDERFEKEKVYNLKAIQLKKQVPENENKEVYTNDLAADQAVACELCGVQLGLGIPEGFRTDPRYNDNLNEYQSQYGVLAPWFCLITLTDTDSELSKRVFTAKCGHVYCGRCVKNIGNAPRARGRQRRDITHPLVYAPLKCGCGGSLKRKFTELYP